MMFRIKTAITGGFKPGELRSADEIAGPDRDRADLDWLVRSGAIEPAGGVEVTKASHGDLMAEVEELTDQLEAERKAHEETRRERDQLRDAAAAADDHAGKLAEAGAKLAEAESRRVALEARVRELEGGATTGPSAGPPPPTANVKDSHPPAAPDAPQQGEADLTDGGKGKAAGPHKADPKADHTHGRKGGK